VVIPEITTSPDKVVVPNVFKSPPTYNVFPIPIPPAVLIEPDVLPVESKTDDKVNEAPEIPPVTVHVPPMTASTTTAKLEPT